MKLTVLLPSYAEEPVGGFRIAYDYAAGLARRGHRVTLLHPGAMSRPASLRERALWIRWWMRRHLRRRRLAPWYAFPTGVRFRLVPWYVPGRLPAADALLATAWETAEVAAAAPPAAGRGCYLIQHFEDWSGDAARIEATFRLPLRKVAIARWLVDLVAGQGARAAHIPNPLDLGTFGIDIDPEDRDPLSVLMMAHTLEWKGTREGLDALERFRVGNPDARVVLFGARPVDDLPSWARFELAPHGARLRALYNEASLFLAPSRSEGWGLTPCEAMACGCAVVATDIPGHREFASDGTNSVLVAPRDSEAMASALDRLAHDARGRVSLARAGRPSLARFAGTASLDAMERFLGGSDA